MTTELANKIEIHADTWLSKMLDKPVFRINANARCDDLNSIAEHASQQSGSMYWTKVEGDQDGEPWESLGFQCVNQQVTLAARGFKEMTGRQNTRGSKDTIVSWPSESQHEDILRIAQNCFDRSRFHVDKNIANEAANRIKRGWTENCLTGKRGDRVFVAQVDDQVSGFLTSIVTEQHGSRAAIIDLVGVDRHAQGRGVGSALVAAFVDHYQGQCEQLRVGTQADNTASLRLYKKFGFEVVETSQVFHLHTNESNE